MGHAFSSHHPSIISNDFQFIYGKLADAELEKYRGFEEDGDQKLWVEGLCKETKECKQMIGEYDACAERIEASGKGHCGYQYMNMWGCIDYCAAEPHFKLLKHGI